MSNFFKYVRQYRRRGVIAAIMEARKVWNEGFASTNRKKESK